MHCEANRCTCVLNYRLQQFSHSCACCRDRAQIAFFDYSLHLYFIIAIYTKIYDNKKLFIDLHALFIAFTIPRFTKNKYAVFFRLLASGDSINTVANLYNVGEATARKILYETCKAIWDTLQPLVRFYFSLSEIFQETNFYFFS